MQRYRVNYTLLVGILVGSVVAAGAIYGVWRWRMTGNASNLLDRAATAKEEGDIRKAISIYNTYLDFKPEDEEILVDRAMLYVDYANQLVEEKEFYEFSKIRNVISDALFKFSGQDDLRRHYLDLLCSPELEPYFAKDSLDQIKILINKSPEDQELLERQARCLVYNKQPREAVEVFYKLVGYNPKTEKFSVEEAIAPNNAKNYAMLARTLNRDLDNTKLAMRVEEQMVQVNPDSADAQLEYGMYLGSVDKGEGSDADYGQKASDALQKAYKLEPTKPEVLLALAEEALRNDDSETAEKYLKEGLQSDTDLAVFYAQLAAMESSKGKHQAALEEIEKGLKKVSENGKLQLLLAKIDVQIDSGDLTGAQATVNEFENEAKMQSPRLELQKARLLAAKDEWLPASKALEDVRSKLVGNIRLQLQADLLLGMAYQKIGYDEKAYEVFKRLVNQFPGNKMALEMLRQAERRLKGGIAASATAASSFDERLKAELAKDEASQNWNAFDQYVQKWCDDNDRTEVQRKLIEAQVLVSRKMYAEARGKLREAYEMAKDDLSVQRAVVKLVAVDPERGPEDALLLLDRTMKNFGDQRLLRLDRADLYMAMNKETLADELMSLTEGIDGWKDSDQIELWKGIATRLIRAKLRDEGEAAWKKVVEMSPNDLPSLMQVFELAASRNDDTAMQQAQELLLKAAGSKDDPTYAFTEAVRNAAKYRNDPKNEKLKEAAFQQVKLALQERPDWSDPYIVRASVKMQDRDFLGALEDYREGFKLGRGNAAALVQYVKLLQAQGNYKEALDQLEPYGASVSVLLIGRDYPQLLFRSGKFRDAAEAAERYATSGKGPESASVQLWYGQFLEALSGLGLVPEEVRNESREKAGEALAKAVELNPDSAATWMAYISNLLVNSGRLMAEANDLEKKSGSETEIKKLREEAAELRSVAESSLRKAQLTLEEDQQALLVARSYENMGRWFDAENTYRLAYEQNPNADDLAKQMALFYMSRRYPLPDGNAKAVSLINDILEQNNEDPESVSKQNANWARRVAARIYASTGSYQDSLKAEKLLASNAENKTLSVEDKLEMAKLLAGRPEPVSRNKAIRLLEEVQAQQRLTPDMDLMLGKLYFAVGNWPKCRDHMISVRTRYPDAFAVRDTYIRMLLDRGGDSDLRDAEDQLRQLQRIAPTSLGTYELASMVYDRVGKKAEAQQAVRKMLPKNMENLQENEYRLIARIAQLLTAMDDLSTAENLLKLLVSRPGASLGDQLAFVQFLGVHRDADKAFSMLDEMAKDDTLVAVAESGISIVRARRSELQDKYDAQIVGWLDRADREDPGAIPIALARASLLDVQGNYEQAANIYREVLKKDRLQGRPKAAVLNNLAYFLALGAAKEQSPNEAVKFLNEATEIMGPTSDILDTRACILINRGEYQKAIDDMEYAVTDKPTASKYFHKALAHMGLKQNSAALAAWNKAKKLGLDRDSVGQLEADKYDEMAAKIAKLEGRSGDL
ncbi:tetratricopeptide repeat protein [Aeoliella mucimassa]|uniref:Tetratricopeptide repeat protein n=1 Tax=Aeoliella mucimassa TaxID=2527972 RepID=A0A518AWH6_9BACT|nr:tetratricopeptide repeat protein [Aeoliella mucimassa]QDU59087.1 tetratricopeptide repeat protein [Aeoliella mucimassa]